MSKTVPTKARTATEMASSKPKPIKTASFAKPVMMPIDVQLVRCLWGNMIIFALCATMAGFVFSSKRQDVLLAYTTKGDLYAPPYSDIPHMSSEAVTNWAVQAITAIYNYDMNNIEQRLIAASDYFTLEGWKSFTAALAEQNFVESVKQNRQIVTSVNAGAPVVIWEEDKKGVHRWGVSVALRISTDSGQSKPSTSNSSVVLTIEEIPTSESPGGYALGIVKLGG